MHTKSDISEMKMKQPEFTEFQVEEVKNDPSEKIISLFSLFCVEKSNTKSTNLTQDKEMFLVIFYLLKFRSLIYQATNSIITEEGEDSWEDQLSTKMRDNMKMLDVQNVETKDDFSIIHKSKYLGIWDKHKFQSLIYLTTNSINAEDEGFGEDKIANTQLPDIQKKVTNGYFSMVYLDIWYQYKSINEVKYFGICKQQNVLSFDCRTTKSMINGEGECFREDIPNESVDQVDSTALSIPNEYIDKCSSLNGTKTSTTDEGVDNNDISSGNIYSDITTTPTNTKDSNTPSLAISKDEPDKYVTDDIDQRSSRKRSKFRNSQFVSSKTLRHTMLRLLIVIKLFAGCTGCTSPNINVSITSDASYNSSVKTVTLTWYYKPLGVDIEIFLSDSKRMIAKWNTNGDRTQTNGDERMRFNRMVSNGIESISLSINRPSLFELYDEIYEISILSSKGCVQGQASVVLIERLIAQNKVADREETTAVANKVADITPYVVVIVALIVIIILLMGILGILCWKQRRNRSVEGGTDETVPALTPPTW